MIPALSPQQKSKEPVVALRVSYARDLVVQYKHQQAHLERANRHIEAAMARTAWLEEILLSQPQGSIEATLAEGLMHNMRVCLCLMVRYRLSVRRSLSQAAPPPWPAPAPVAPSGRISPEPEPRRSWERDGGPVNRGSYKHRQAMCIALRAAPR
jgi:hypothetical protein